MYITQQYVTFVVDIAAIQYVCLQGIYKEGYGCIYICSPLCRPSSSMLMTLRMMVGTEGYSRSPLYKCLASRHIVLLQCMHCKADILYCTHCNVCIAAYILYCNVLQCMHCSRHIVLQCINIACRHIALQCFNRGTAIEGHIYNKCMYIHICPNRGTAQTQGPGNEGTLQYKMSAARQIVLQCFLLKAFINRDT